MPFANRSKQCKAKSKRSQRRCENPAMKGMEVCYYHGGKSKRGLDHPRYKTGMDSKYNKAPKDLQERYEKALQDPELLSMSHEVAIIDARLTHLIENSNTGDSKAAWEEVKKAVKVFRAAQHVRNTDLMAQAWLEIEEAVEKGSREHDTWEEIVRLIEQRRKVAGGEMNRRLKLGQLITARQALELVTRISGIIQKRVPDESIRALIAGDIGQLVDIDVMEGDYVEVEN